MDSSSFKSFLLHTIDCHLQPPSPSRIQISSSTPATFQPTQMSSDPLSSKTKTPELEASQLDTSEHDTSEGESSEPQLTNIALPAFDSLDPEFWVDVLPTFTHRTFGRLHPNYRWHKKMGKPTSLPDFYVFAPYYQKDDDFKDISNIFGVNITKWHPMFKASLKHGNKDNLKRGQANSAFERVFGTEKIMLALLEICENNRSLSALSMVNKNIFQHAVAVIWKVPNFAAIEALSKMNSTTRIWYGEKIKVLDTYAWHTLNPLKNCKPIRLSALEKLHLRTKDQSMENLEIAVNIIGGLGSALRHLTLCFEQNPIDVSQQDSEFSDIAGNINTSLLISMLTQKSVSLSSVEHFDLHAPSLRYTVSTLTTLTTNMHNLKTLSLSPGPIDTDSPAWSWPVFDLLADLEHLTLTTPITHPTKLLHTLSLICPMTLLSLRLPCVSLDLNKIADSNIFFPVLKTLELGDFEKGVSIPQAVFILHEMAPELKYEFYMRNFKESTFPRELWKPFFDGHWVWNWDNFGKVMKGCLGGNGQKDFKEAEEKEYDEEEEDEQEDEEVEKVV